MMRCRWIVFLIALALLASHAVAQDWPQFQQNAERHGRIANGPAAPFRARWVWFGPEHILRNKESNPQWTDDLRGRDGFSINLPASVPMTTCATRRWMSSGKSPRKVSMNKAMPAIHDRYSTRM